MRKPVPDARGQAQRRHERVLEVHEAPAGLADEVVVPARHRVEAGDPAGVVHLAGEAGVHERLQDAVDGRARQAGQPPAHRVVDLVGRRVVPAAGQLAEHGAALDRHRQAAAAALGLELGEAGRSVGNRH